MLCKVNEDGSLSEVASNGGGLINDEKISASETWSSKKINESLVDKVDKHTNDVSPTTFDANRSNFSNGTVTYMVINNMCHLTYSGLKPIPTGNDITIGTVPKPCVQLFNIATSDKGVSKGLIGIYSNGILAMNTDGSADKLYGSLVYEVAKS